MIRTTQIAGKAQLLLAAAPFAMMFGTMPAFAQDTAPAQDAAPAALTPTPPTPADEAATPQDVVVTGSLIATARPRPPRRSTR